MTLSGDFFRSVLDSVTEHIVIIDHTGAIQYVNAAWKDFGTANGCAISHEWKGVNYLDVCDASAARRDPHGRRAAAGAREVIGGKSDAFYYEYPCHSPAEQRWFMMRVTRLRWEHQRCFIISHQNITERRMAEERVRILSLKDGLTGVANRRHFDEFLSAEWRRAARLGSVVSLMLIDVDEFKPYNDHYGHQAGDACLKRIGTVLSTFGKRPGDLCARYGGEEFALVLGNTDRRSAARIAEQVLAAIRAQTIPHDRSTVAGVVTASLGLAALYPRKDTSEDALIEAADRALYAAKSRGRNRVWIDGGATG